MRNAILPSILLLLSGGVCCHTAFAAPRKVAAPVLRHDPEIINTGSTNTRGYSVFIGPNGEASWVLGSGIHDQNGKQFFITHGKISTILAHQFFVDVKAAQPLGKLPVGHGMKSASFGTSIYIEYEGQQTPDLSFPVSGQETALVADIKAIAQALGLRDTPRHFGTPKP